MRNIALDEYLKENPFGEICATKEFELEDGQNPIYAIVLYVPIEYNPCNNINHETTDFVLFANNVKIETIVKFPCSMAHNDAVVIGNTILDEYERTCKMQNASNIGKKTMEEQCPLPTNLNCSEIYDIFEREYGVGSYREKAYLLAKTKSQIMKLTINPKVTKQELKQLRKLLKKM